MVKAWELHRIADSIERDNRITAYDLATVCRAIAENIDRVKCDVNKNAPTFSES